MAVRIQVRRDTATGWTTKNPVLLAGEIGAELGTEKWKLGDGVTDWNSMEYAIGAKGEKGDKGDTGYNAYEFWLSLGYIGTEAEYLAFIKGETGNAGIVVQATEPTDPNILVWIDDDDNEVFLTDFVTPEEFNLVKASPTVSVVEDKTLLLTDATTIQVCQSNNPIIVTVPPNLDVALPINTEIVLVRYGVGTVTVASGIGVIINSSDGKKSINKQFEAVTLKKIYENEWLLIGSLKL